MGVADVWRRIGNTSSFNQPGLSPGLIIALQSEPHIQVAETGHWWDGLLMGRKGWHTQNGRDTFGFERVVS